MGTNQGRLFLIQPCHCHQLCMLYVYGVGVLYVFYVLYESLYGHAYLAGA
jgi:hypothetical protein